MALFGNGLFSQIIFSDGIGGVNLPPIPDGTLWIDFCTNQPNWYNKTTTQPNWDDNTTNAVNWVDIAPDTSTNIICKNK